jgi:hypothetical protein
MQDLSTFSGLENYYEKSHSIIIGISKYQEEEALLNAYNDAIAIKGVLEAQYGFTNAISLFNEDASDINIRELFLDTILDQDKIGPKDRVLIYYSGHAKLRISINYEGAEIKEGYIVPYNSKRNKYSSYIPMETIIDACQKCPAKHVLLILDCCYSGYAATRAVEPPEKPWMATEAYLKNITSRRAIQVMAAGSEDEPVSDSGIRPGYSAFTGALLDILESGSDLDNDGILTASEIGSHLVREMARQTSGPLQRPVFSNIAGSSGDFVFKVFSTINTTGMSDKEGRSNKPISTLVERIPNDVLLPTYIETDIWTTRDKLNYQIYAIAVANFLTKKETKSPLSISIQAPWGGGKSSLMRMIQEQLDKVGAQLAYKKMSDEPFDKVKLKELKSWAWKKKIEDLKIWKRKEKDPQEIKIPGFDGGGFKVRPCVTIWFNAWKYESTEQVWAGLADSIVREIAGRMTPVKREWFFLQLNLRRMNIDSIRRWIYDQSLSYLWQKIHIWVRPAMFIIAIFLTIYIFGSVRSVDLIFKQSNFYGISTSDLFFKSGFYGAISTAVIAGLRALLEKRSIDNEPSHVSLGKYVNVPDYNDKLGFIHHYSEDLQIILETIPHDYLPLVIFIDDLDRCSPNNIAQVIEGINLFLAGEFKNCMFVMGMDAEMVAAALEVAHKDVISKLAKYSTQTPIGWRFMDKFVQLPIIIPPVSDMTNYLGSLYSVNIHQEEGTEGYKQPSTQLSKKRIVLSSLLKRLFKTTTDRESARDEVVSTNRPTAKSSDKEEDKLLGLEGDQQRFVRDMTDRIRRSTDKDREFLEQIEKATSDFSNNPRDIKRFVNVLRFQRFVWYGIKELRPGKEPCSFDQLRRWIILSMKWPALVRWLYWSQEGLNDEEDAGRRRNTTQERLEILENLGASSTDQNDWQKNVERALNAKSDSVVWVGDDELRRFFKHEGELKEKSERLSAAAGKGIY